MATFRGVLAALKSCPTMYIGRKSISCLQAFLNGWEFAHEGVVEDSAMMGAFQEWVARKCAMKTTQSWDRLILFESQDEADALDRFFAWFDEFLSSYQEESSKHGKAMKNPGPKARRPA